MLEKPCIADGGPDDSGGAIDASDGGSPSKGEGWQRATSWTVIRRAGYGPDAYEARSTLAQWYEEPIRAFYRRLGTRSLDPADLTQGLFMSLLARNDFAQLDPQKGRFRPWLRQAATHYFYKQLARLHPEVPIDPADEKRQLSFCADDSNQRDCDRLMDLCWAEAVVARALALLEEHHVNANNRVHFEHLKRWAARDNPGISDDSLARRLDKSVGAIRKAKCDMLGKFRHYVRAEIARFVSDPGEIDEEIEYLIEVLSTDRVDPAADRPAT